MHIPIENIYYLLCYAWNTLEEKDRVAVSVDDRTELLYLLAKVLINATRILLKRGIDRNYMAYTGELAGIRGKLETSQTIKANLLQKQRTICSYDDFSPDILQNQILVSTMYHLLKTKGLDKSLRDEIRKLLSMFPSIKMIKLKPHHFKQIRLHRNNRFYAFIINVCQLIYENSLPAEQPGTWHFTDFTRDEKKMNRLFEAFIFNFYKVEQQIYSVKREIINWQFTANHDDHERFLPLMRTDITLQNDHKKIIIDAKYYRETMALHYNVEKIKSVNLYQLFSYLLNQEDGTERSLKTTGVLLYPTIQQEYDLHYQYRSHTIWIKTINLNTHWKNIRSRLLQSIN